MKANVIICGVGGQGVILASEVLSLAALRAGLNVKKSEVHGMAQRGGAVVSHVRVGKEVFSPLVEPGSCDLIISFEKAEALRWAKYLKPDGVIVVNQREIIPVTVTQGLSEYPHDAIDRLRDAGFKVVPVEATRLALEAGDPRTENIAMLGASSAYLPIPPEALVEAIKLRVPKKYVEVNLRAFRLGKEVVA